MLKPIVCLMGPTGVGKTQLAIDLLEYFPFELISVDSAMVYQGMDIGSAKPSPAILARAPHRLIDLIKPCETYSVANFCRDAWLAIDDIKGRGKWPLLVGGTMMYYRALQQGLSSLPQANEAMRKQMQEQAAQKGWAFLHQQLQEVDELAARRINPRDSQRIQRALEVHRLTGIPLSKHWQDDTQRDHHQFLNLALFPDKREFLHRCIARRFDEMLKEGLVEEVQGLIEQFDLSFESPAMKCVGYRQVGQYLQGSLTASDMRDKAIVATRQLAKRQLTWLRHWPAALYFTPWHMALKRQVIDFLSQ